jgi:large subunit ribosomal protein L3
VKKIGFKNTPDIAEIGLSGTREEKINFIKENLNKTISLKDVLDGEKIVDVRGLTKGKGTQGPVKRFGISLKVKKSEKGQRRPGNIGPWHPARVTFRIPMAGQLGMFSRVNHNNPILEIGDNKKREIKNIKNYGDITTSYIIVSGSIQGPSKRQVLVTKPYRSTKKQIKKSYEIKDII